MVRGVLAEDSRGEESICPVCGAGKLVRRIVSHDPVDGNEEGLYCTGFLTPHRCTFRVAI